MVARLKTATPDQRRRNQRRNPHQQLPLKGVLSSSLRLVERQGGEVKGLGKIATFCFLVDCTKRIHVSVVGHERGHENSPPVSPTNGETKVGHPYSDTACSSM